MIFEQKIKELRRSKDLTQERLAELLSVSPQAVSRWETGTAMPDISLLIPLANIFDITIDELLGRESEKAVAMEAYKKQIRKLLNEGNIPEVISLCRSINQKYPNDFTILYNLAHALVLNLFNGSGATIDESNAKEAIGISERIMKDCTDDHIRSQTLQLLVILYSNPTACPSVADEEKAVRLANSATSFWTSKEFLLEKAYFTEESKEKQLNIKHNNILSLLERITSNIYWEIYDEPQDRLYACESALALWETVISDGNYLFYHSRIQTIYKIIAECYAEMDNAEGTIGALTKAMYHAKQSDRLPYGVLKFTSPLVKYATIDTTVSIKNFSKTMADLLRSQIKHNPVFDFIRDDPRFFEIIK